MNRTTSRTPGDLARPLARGHVGALLAVAFAVLGGTAMMTVAAVLLQTGLTAHVPPQRLAGAPILVSAPQHVAVVEDFDVPLPDRAPVPESLRERIAGIDGVSTAAPDVSFPATVDGVATTAHNWEVAALTEPALSGSAPGPDQVVLDDGLAEATGASVGDRVHVTVDGSDRVFRVSGVVDAPGATLHLDPATAGDLSGLPEDEADLFAITVDDDSDVSAVARRVADVVGDDYVVSTGDDRGEVESVTIGTARGQLIELGGALAGTLLLLVGCITAGALATSVAGRRRDLALLRAVGMTPRQVRRLVATQATWATCAGLLPGLAIGHLLAQGFADWLVSHGLVSADLPLPASPYAALAVATLTLLVVQVASRVTTWRASRRPAREAMVESEVEPREPSRWRTGLGLALVVSALGQSVLPLFAGGEAAFLSAASGTLVGVIGLALAGPALTRAVTGRLAAGRRGTTSPVGWLAVHNTHAWSLRSAGAVTVLALAASVTITQFYALSTLARATEQERSDGIVAAASVTGAVTARDAEELAARPGIDAAVPLVSTTVLHTTTVAGEQTTESHPAMGVGAAADRVLDPDVRDGDLSALHGDTVALDASAAGSWDVSVGDRVDLVLANGVRVRPTVVATYGRGFGFGTALVSTDLLHQHGSGRLLDAVLVAGDTDAATDWAAGRDGVRVEPGAPTTDREAASAEQWVNLIVLLPMLGYVLVAAGNSLAAATVRRRGELATLRVIGATPRQIRSMVTREAGVLAGLAIGAALVLSVLPMSVLGLGILGRPWPQGAWWVAPGMATLVVVIAVGAMRGAATRLLSRPPLG